MKKLLFILLTLSLNSFGQTAEEYNYALPEGLIFE